MKSLLVVLTILSSSFAFAQAGRTCPATLSFSASGVSTNAVSFGKLSAKLTLTNSNYTKCSYRGQDQNGEYVSASIQRSSRRGASAKGTLYINFENLNLRTMTKLKTISASKVGIDYSTYRGVKKSGPTTIISTETGKVVSITKKHSVRL